MNSDGSDEKNVALDPDHDDYDPAWRSDGLMITYVSTERAPPNMYAIRSVNTDGTIREFLNGSSVRKSAPCWSPDGTEIVFASNRSGDVEIYVMEADGTDVRRLTNSEGSNGFPACAIARN
jgi:TolB protein